MFVSFVFTLISEPRATVCSGTLMERDSSCLENGCSFCLGGADWAVLMTAAAPPISSNANVLIALPPYCTPLRLGFTRKVNSRTLEKHKDAPPGRRTVASYVIYGRSPLPLPAVLAGG